MLYTLYIGSLGLPHNAMHLVDIKVASKMSIRPQIYVNAVNMKEFLLLEDKPDRRECHIP